MAICVMAVPPVGDARDLAGLFVTNSASAPTTSMRIALFGTVAANVSEVDTGVPVDDAVADVSTRIGLVVNDRGVADVVGGRDACRRSTWRRSGTVSGLVTAVAPV